HVPRIMAHKPIGLEGFDELLIELMRKKEVHPEQVRMLPAGNGWLLVEFGSDSKDDATAHARALMAELAPLPDAPNMALFADDREARKLWEVREAALGIAANPLDEKATWEGWEDAAVAPERLGRYLRE